MTVLRAYQSLSDAISPHTTKSITDDTDAPLHVADQQQHQGDATQASALCSQEILAETPSFLTASTSGTWHDIERPS
jgi:hypothetical protein